MIPQRVAILGCGPAGLLAARAVWDAGHTPYIYSKKAPSIIFGAQFLHIPVDGVTAAEPDFEINVIKWGSRRGYAYNVYGDPAADVSWGHYRSGAVLRAWDMRKAYDRLWGFFFNQIRHIDLTPAKVEEISSTHHLVYSTIPLPTLCTSNHEFKKQDIWVLHGDGTSHLIEGVNNGNYLYYNGFTPQGASFEMEMFGPDWYRFSQLNGYQSWEFSQDPSDSPGIYTDRYRLDTGIKPLENNCDCWPAVRRLGRFGRWEKGQLVHHAYEQVRRDLLDL